MHYQVLDNGVQDKDVAVSSLRAAQKKVGDKIAKASFDRGFHTPENQRELAEVVAHPCVPVRGAKQEARQQAEATIDFAKAGNGIRAWSRRSTAWRRAMGWIAVGIARSQGTSVCRARIFVGPEPSCPGKSGVEAGPRAVWQASRSGPSSPRASRLRSL